MIIKIKKIGFLLFGFTISSCKQDYFLDDKFELDLEKSIQSSQNHFRTNESETKPFIPLNSSTYIDYQYEGEDKNYSFNIIIENADTLKLVDHRIFSRGIFGNIQYKQTKNSSTPKEMTFIEISQELASDLNQISLDMLLNSQQVSFDKVNTAALPVMSPVKKYKGNTTTIFQEQKIDPMIEKIKTLKSLYLNKDYHAFLKLYKTLKIEVSIPEYKKKNSIQDMFDEVVNLAFIDGLMKREGLPIPIFTFSKEDSESKIAVEKRNLNILYHKSITLDWENQHKFIFTLFLVEKFNPDLLKIYTETMEYVSNYDHILNDPTIKETVQKLISANNGNPQILLTIFNQSHSHFDMTKDSIIKSLISKAFEKELN